MPLSLGDKLGPYEIVSQIGAGGMGEVYKARDTRLDRIVAVKVSKTEFTERFEREARAVAALNHPHICQVYDVGPNYLVMEYIEGAPLKGPLPLETALDYARQIASALDTAHTAKITHRDLKPANILVTKQGDVKLLDFGLAKFDKPVAVDEATLTMGLTAKGAILGTLTYMSPEQVSGLEAGPRSDIFSSGLVLYEMLTGKQAFAGATAASVIGAILERPAPSVEGIAPASLDRVLKRCLEKDPERRWQSARDLDAALELVSSEPTALPASPRSRVRNAMPWAVAGAAALAMLVVAFLYFRQAPAPDLPSVRFQVAPPEKLGFDSFHVSPDGRVLAFVSQRRIWIRALDSLQSRPVDGSEGAEGFFWSPDSQFLAFMVQGKLKKMAVSGGPAQILGDTFGTWEGSWSRDGVILFAPSFSSGLVQIPANGGTPAPLTWLASAGRVTTQLLPRFLPDGRHFLFTQAGKPEESGIWLSSLDKMPPRLLLPDLSNAEFVRLPGKPEGYLLFARSGALMAQPFDVNKLDLSGEAFPIQDKVAGEFIFWAFSVSQNGTLVYAPAASSSTVQLAWKDRGGKQLSLFGPPGTYHSFRLSPDDRRIVFDSVQSGNDDIWIMDSARGVSSRLTFDPAPDNLAMWSPDGLRVVWPSLRSGSFDLYIKPANGAGADQLLVKMGTPTGWGEDWTRDGRFLIYQVPGAKTGQDLWIAPQSANGDAKPYPYLQSEFDEMQGRFSLDGKWVAYVSNESGRPEVYVQSFPATGAKFQVSSNGGAEPQWRKDGTELFYITIEDQMLTAIPVKSGDFQVGQPKPLFQVPVSNPFLGRSYAVSNDGQRFLVPLTGNANSAPLTVVLNWWSGLKK